MRDVISPFEAKLKRHFPPHRRRALVDHRDLRRPAAAERLLRAQGAAGQLARPPDRRRPIPTYGANKRFEKVFGHGEYVLVLVEADDPFAPDVLERFDELEQRRRPGAARRRQLRALHLQARQGRLRRHARAPPRRSSSSSPARDLFRKQGLVGDALPGAAAVPRRQRHARRASPPSTASTGRSAPFEQRPAPLQRLRKVGQPYVNAYLDNDTRTSGYKYFPLFLLFVIVLNWLLYRSFRALVRLPAHARRLRGADRRLHRRHRRHLHHRLVAGADDHPHHLHRDAGLPALALRRASADETHDSTSTRSSRWPTSSSPARRRSSPPRSASRRSRCREIRPIREMGLWVAVGLVLHLDHRLHALSGAAEDAQHADRAASARPPASGSSRFTRWLPRWSYRWRWLLVPGALRLVRRRARSRSSASPGLLKPMELQTNAIEYITARLGALQGHQAARGADRAGCRSPRCGSSGKPGSVSDAPVLRGLAALLRRARGRPARSAP